MAPKQILHWYNTVYLQILLKFACSPRNVLQSTFLYSSNGLRINVSFVPRVSLIDALSSCNQSSLKHPATAQEDDSAGISTSHQAWELEFKPWDSHCGRRELTPKSCPLGSLHTHTHCTIYFLRHKVCFEVCCYGLYLTYRLWRHHHWYCSSFITLNAWYSLFVLSSTLKSHWCKFSLLPQSPSLWKSPIKGTHVIGSTLDFCAWLL